MTNAPKTQKGWWNLLQTQTPESVSWKVRFDRDSAAIREYLRGCSMRDCAEFSAEFRGKIPAGYFDGLTEVHPRALVMLTKYGTDFIPHLWDERPFDEPKPRACFANSALYQYCMNRAARRNKSDVCFGYVEGIAFGCRTSAVLHAWNTLDVANNLAIDWTWYAVTGWTFYFGIALTQRQHERVRKLAYPEGGFHLLFKKEVFPRIEDALTDILKKRKSKKELPKSLAVT